MVARAFVPLNALGVICTVGYAGYTTTPAHTPWGGYLATCLFFISAVIPIIREYRRLNAGFLDFESTYLENRHREHTPPKQEVIGPTRQASIARPRSPRKKTHPFYYALTGIAVFSLLCDAVYRYAHLPPEPEAPNLISNF